MIFATLWKMVVQITMTALHPSYHLSIIKGCGTSYTVYPYIIEPHPATVAQFSVGLLCNHQACPPVVRAIILPLLLQLLQIYKYIYIYLIPQLTPTLVTTPWRYWKRPTNIYIVMFCSEPSCRCDIVSIHGAHWAPLVFLCVSGITCLLIL